MIPTKCTYDNTTTVGSLLYVISSFLSCLLFTILHYHVVFAVFPVSTVDAATNGCDSATSGNSTPFVATDVIIVGAGTAGISAYREIQRLEPSMKIILLEATDRIGGRVKLAKVGGYTVEQGANWLHGDGTEFR